MEVIFQSIFTGTQDMSIWDFLLCFVVAVVLGVAVSAVINYKSNGSSSFRVTLALLPAVVALVIQMVNGNIGAGVAVAGAFSLVRFRSVPGTAKEICAIFIAMAVGLAVGMGYLGYAALFVILICIAFPILDKVGFGNKYIDNGVRSLRITIAEDLNYTEVFNDVFAEYASQYRLTKVKTTNLGSMFKLNYTLTLKDISSEKEMIDKLRCRNGNLEIVCGHDSESREEL